MIPHARLQYRHWKRGNSPDLTSRAKSGKPSRLLYKNIFILRSLSVKSQVADEKKRRVKIAGSLDNKKSVLCTYIYYFYLIIYSYKYLTRTSHSYLCLHLDLAFLSFYSFPILILYNMNFQDSD